MDTTTHRPSLTPHLTIPQGILLTTLVLLSASGLVASDINLPGMPLAAQALDAPITALQQTFSVYVIGLAVAQALYGALSDTYGRRRLVIGGMAVYALASIACALAPSVALFGLARVFQALGAGAGMVIGRAIIGDIFDAKRAARIFTTIMPIVGASPALAPLVGGYLTDYVSWRAPFLLTAALGVAAVVLMLLYIPETMPQARRQRSAFVTFRNYPMLLRQPRFWTYALNLCVAYAAYLGYLAASPVILEHMGLGPKAASTCYISLSVTYIFSNLVSRHFAGRVCARSAAWRWLCILCAWRSVPGRRSAGWREHALAGDLCHLHHHAGQWRADTAVVCGRCDELSVHGGCRLGPDGGDAPGRRIGSHLHGCRIAGHRFRTGGICCLRSRFRMHRISAFAAPGTAIRRGAGDNLRRTLSQHHRAIILLASPFGIIPSSTFLPDLGGHHGRSQTTRHASRTRYPSEIPAGRAAS